MQNNHNYNSEACTELAVMIKSLPEPSLLAGEQLHAFCMAMETLKQYEESVRQELFARVATEGLVIPGVRIETKAGSRSWDPTLGEEKIAATLKEKGIAEPMITTTKLMTMGEAIKKVGEIGVAGLVKPGIPTTKLVVEEVEKTFSIDF